MDSRVELRLYLKIFSLLVILSLLGPGVLAEDGVYVLEKGQGFHRVGQTMADTPSNLPSSVVDFEVTEDGLGIYVLDDSGLILTEGAGAAYKGVSLEPSQARRVAVSRQGYAILDADGRIHFGGGQPPLDWNTYLGRQVARDVELTPEGDGMVVLDCYGGLHYRGNVPELTSPFFGWDIARDVELAPDGQGYYVLDGFGFIHSIGPIPDFGGQNLGWDIARDLELTQSGRGFYILDGFGSLHIGGDAIPFDVPFFGWDVATDIEISPRPMGALTGRVLSGQSAAAGEPIVGALISLVRQDVPEEAILQVPGSGPEGPRQAILPIRTWSRAGGKYRFEALPAGSYAVTVQAPGYEEYQGEVELPAGEETTVDFVLFALEGPPPSSEYGSVEGTVAEDTGPLDVFIPIPGARVSIHLTHRWVLTTRTDEMGHFEFPHVPAGDHPVHVRAEGYFPTGHNVQVEAGDVAAVSFLLKPRPVSLGRGRVFGKVWYDNMADCAENADCLPYAIPVPGARLHLVPRGLDVIQSPLDGVSFLPEPGTVGWHTVSDASGEYEFNNIPYGRYILIAVAEGFAPARREFVLGRDCLEVNPIPLEIPFGTALSINLGDFELSFDAAIKRASDSVANLLVPGEDNPVLIEEELIRAEVSNLFEATDCPVIAIVAGGFHAENQRMMGRLYSPDGKQLGVLNGHYTPEGDGGGIEGRVVENGTNRQYGFAGDYSNNDGWGRFDADWEQIFPEGIPRNGKMFGLWRRFSEQGGYFIGLWTTCATGCDEIEINVQLFPLVQEFGSIFGTVRAATNDANGVVAPPLPGAVIHAIPLYFEVDPAQWLPFDDRGRFPAEQGARPPEGFFRVADENGNYRFEMLPPGRYQLVATAQGYLSARRDVFLPPNAELEENFLLLPIVHETGRIEGIVAGGALDSSTVERPPEPIEGAVVVLVPAPRPRPLDPAMDASPVGDALMDEVELVPELISDMEISRRFRQVTTAADGSYAFEDVPVGHYRLVAKARGYFPQSQQADVFKDETTTVNFVLRPKPPIRYGSLVGSVTDALSGDPVARAVVTVWPLDFWSLEQPHLERHRNGELCSRDAPADFWRPMRTLTDENGDYEFPRLRVGPYRITVRALGYEPTEGRVRIIEGRTSVRNFALRPVPPAGSVVGRVFERTDSGDPGPPIPGALVTLIPWDLAASGNSESGLLVDDIDPAGHIFRTRTNLQGEYEFPQVPAGRYLMRVQKYGFEPARRRVNVPPGTTVREDFGLRPVGPPPSGTVVGAVYAVDENGGDPEPIPGAFVFLFKGPHWNNAGGAQGGPGHFFARTNDQGEYAFDEVPAGVYLMLAGASGYEPDFRRVTVLPDEITQEDFFLHPFGTEPGGRIFGHVYNAAALSPMPQPIPGVRMVLFHWPDSLVTIPEIGPDELLRELGLPVRTTRTNEEGFYEFGDLPGGLYVLFALKEGFEPGFQLAQLPQGGEQRIDSALVPLREPPPSDETFVHGVVQTEASGALVPVPGAVVSAFEILPTLQDSTVLSPEDGSGNHDPFVTRTDEQGRYRLPPLFPTSWTITVHKRGFEPAQQEVSVAEGEEREVNFLLERVSPLETGRFEGRVWTANPSGSSTMQLPVPGARVSLVPDSYLPLVPIETTTDFWGHFSFPDLLVDEYTVTIEKQGFETRQARIAIVAGEVLRVLYELAPDLSLVETR